MRSESWLSAILRNGKSDEWIIIPEKHLYASWWVQVMDSIKERYNIGVMCELNSIYCSTDQKMVLVFLTETEISDVKISICNYRPHSFNNQTTQSFKNKDILPDSYSKNYLRYLSALERWINDNVLPDNSLKKAEFKTLTISETDKRHMYPKYYTEEAIAVRKLLSDKDMICLADVAEIIRPRKSKTDLIGKCLDIKDLKYPFNRESVENNTITSVALDKGDIVLPNFNTGFVKPFLYPGSKETVYAPVNTFVIRCINILPEYLFLYLSSELFNVYYESTDISIPGAKLSIGKIKNFPIIIPAEQNDQKYIDAFNSLTFHGKRIYSDEQNKILNDCIDKIREFEKEGGYSRCKTIEDIINIEIAYGIKSYRSNELQSFLTDDLRELNTCFNGKAYKATLILAGSILEAVLIDWLSEIHHKDYFENDYYVSDRNGKKRKAGLVDYINEIKEIKRPDWMNEAEKAHIIRKKRNLVHAKLCLKSLEEINESLCRRVIDYLLDVLKTRGIE